MFKSSHSSKILSMKSAEFTGLSAEKTNFYSYLVLNTQHSVQKNLLSAFFTLTDVA